MGGKIAVIESEFTEVSSNIKSIHQEMINSCQTILKSMDAIVSDGGSLISSEFSPKVTGLTSSLQTDVINRMETVFQTTETAISDFENMVVNVDTSC